MKNLNELIKIFLEVLNDTWPKMHSLIREDGDSILIDWMQATWEFVVENNIQNSDYNPYIYLNPYGEGADFYGTSSRILTPEAQPTHEVCCYSSTPIKDYLSKTTVSFPKKAFPIDCFVSMQNGLCYEKPPFEYAFIFIDNDQKYVFKIDELNFTLNKIPQLKIL